MAARDPNEPLLERTEGRSLGCSMFVVYFAVFVDMLGFGLIMPSLPKIAVKTFGSSEFMIGVITAAFSIAQMIGSVVCGILSDKWGRRPILTFCLLGSAISLVSLALLTTYEPDLTLFILLRALGGAMSATVGIAQAYIADCSKPSERAKYMGMVGAASGFGVVAGPVLGPFLANLYASIYGSGADGRNLDGFIFICYCGAGISLVNFIMAVIFLREAPKTLKRKSEVALKGGTPNAFAVMRRDLNIVLVFLGFMLAQFGFTTFQTLFVIYVGGPDTHGKYTWSEGKIGLVFALFGVAMILTQMIATAPLSRFLGDKWATIAGSFLRGVGLAVLPFVDLNTGTPVHENWMIACVMAIAVSGSLVNPCLSAIVANFSDRRTQGTILGINQMFGAFARAAAPLIAAYVYTLDQTSAWTYFGGLSCGLCCLVLIPLKVPVVNDVKSRITSLVNTAAESDPEVGGKEIYAYGEGAVARGDDHVEGYDFETDTEDNDMRGDNSMQDFTHERPYDRHSPPSDGPE